MHISKEIYTYINTYSIKHVFKKMAPWLFIVLVASFLRQVAMHRTRRRCMGSWSRPHLMPAIDRNMIFQTV